MIDTIFQTRTAQETILFGAAHIKTTYMRKYFSGTLFSQSYTLTQTNTHNPLAVGAAAIAVESHARITGGSRAEVR